MIDFGWLLALSLVGCILSLLAERYSKKLARIYLPLGIVAVLLAFGRSWIVGGQFIIFIMFICILLEAIWFRHNYNWASKETLKSVGISSFSLLLIVTFQILGFLIFKNLIHNSPLQTVSRGLASIGTSLWLQVLIVLVLIDFKRYWLHRLDHSVNLFWRIHKIHHGITELHFISGSRDHPIYNLIQAISDIGIVYFIGIAPEAYAISIIINIIFASFIAHLNVDFPRLEKKFPWFAYLIVTPNFHAWHHTIHCQYATNLADIFPFWDVLFGTFEMPHGKPRTWQFGLQESEQLPPSVWRQIISPLFFPLD